MQWLNIDREMFSLWRLLSVNNSNKIKSYVFKVNSLLLLSKAKRCWAHAFFIIMHILDDLSKKCDTYIGNSKGRIQKAEAGWGVEWNNGKKILKEKKLPDSWSCRESVSSFVTLPSSPSENINSTWWMRLVILNCAFMELLNCCSPTVLHCIKHLLCP